MTREEAIERIKQNKAAAEFYVQMMCKSKSVDNELKDIEAFNMAIEALQNLSKPNNGLQGSDLISRPGAIDAIRKSTEKYAGFMEMEQYTDEDAVDAINSLPSADAVQIPIKLEKRYPQSRDEDITDAFMRGYLAGRSSADRPTGEWQDEHGKPMCLGSFAGYCSNCGKWSEYLTDYCGNCGAKMGDDTE